MENYENKVKEFIANKLKIDQGKISLNDKIEDLCQDSIQIFELIMEFEKEIGHKLGYEDICKIETIGDAVNKMKELNIA